MSDSDRTVDGTTDRAVPEARVELDGKDLPAFCPNPRMPVWSHHPRVFLNVTHGQAACPYCGTRYVLKPGTVVHSH